MQTVEIKADWNLDSYEDTITMAFAQALQEAAAQGISGKASTPFLLARVNELTGGDSLASNIALVLNNARLACAIALAYAGLGQ